MGTKDISKEIKNWKYPQWR